MNNTLNPSPCENCGKKCRNEDGFCTKTLQGKDQCHVWREWFCEEWRRMQDLFGASELKKLREYHNDNARNEG